MNERDEFPLTSDDYGGADDFDEQPLTAETPLTGGAWNYEEHEDLELQHTRPITPVGGGGRKEAIERLAEEQRSGNVVPPSHRAIPKIYADPRRRQAERPGANPNRRGVHPQQRPIQRRANTDLPMRRPLVGKKNKSMFAPFYIAMIVMAVAVLMVVALVLFNNFMNTARSYAPGQTSNNPVVALLQRAFFWQNPIETLPPGGGDMAFTPVRQDLNHQTALVVATAQPGGVGQLTLMDVSDRRERVFTVSSTARITGRGAVPMAFSDLRVGMVLDIGYDAYNEIATVAESPRATERRARTNVQVDVEGGTVTVGNEVFLTNSQTIVLYRGEPFPLTQITPLDSVTVVAVGYTAWLVQLEAAHGFLQVVNADMVMNGRLTVGTQHMLLETAAEEPVFLHEGVHRVVVDGDNIEPFITSVTVEQGRTVTLNAGDATLRAALLHLNVTPADADVFINGVAHRPPGPILLDFGAHTVRIERDGYTPQEQEINIINPVNTVNFQLEELVVAAPEATLSIFTTPANAEIFIDNVFMGFSVLSINLPPGTHNITARLAGHSDTNYSVTLNSGEVRTIHLLMVLGAPPAPTLPTAAPGEDLPDIHPTNPFPDEP
jgi:hypothetical protein